MPAGQPFTALCKSTARRKEFGRCDLHVHSTWSDGSYSPKQIVELASRSGLAALAITDHDTVAGVEETKTASAPGLEIVSGVEISAEYKGRELHLLGYFFDEQNASLQTALKDLRDHRAGRYREMIVRLRARGIDLSEEGTAGCREGASLGRRHLANLLVQARRAGSVREAFSRYLHDGAGAAVPKVRLHVGQAIECVRGAGGVASWAHPSYDCTPQTLAELRQLGLQAVEVDFPGCRVSRARELRAWAAELGLAVTGGSDCHDYEPMHQTIGARGISERELDNLRQLKAY